VEPIVNGAWAEGIASSLRVGATAVPRGTTAALIVDVARACDAGECVRLVRQHRASGAAMVAAGGDAAARPPMIVDAGVLAELRNLGAGGDALAELLARHRVVPAE
jgi:CTP:molybdopterin cytidylyltransferase MocA